ncbi:hypothetical protein [Bacillus sonorensis]|uniref:hypothetical protein n=1 Tax=Bacillus sonorensis TaxID=119858 RepID=UPI00034A8BAE|nr:hypothetical protein [Bacillus sonorensis]TWK73914.1 hypothetical protein CHCC20335_2199 [Bacillus paralicheniformis]
MAETFASFTAAVGETVSFPGLDIDDGDRLAVYVPLFILSMNSKAVIPGHQMNRC